MTKRRLVQIASGLTPGDATTTEVAFVRDRVLRDSQGSFSDCAVFAEHLAEGLDFPARQLDRYEERPGDVVLCHYGIAFRDWARICRLQSPLFLKYHNVTPARYFRPYDLRVSAELVRARSDLFAGAAAARAAFADSAYSARELSRYGFRNVGVVPLLGIHTDRMASGAVQAELDAPQDAAASGAQHGGRDLELLFVGRLAPNKGHEDLLKCLYYLRCFGARARLNLVGPELPGLEVYRRNLESLARSLGVRAHVNFAGRLSYRDLRQAYQRADVFLCMSRHEGFCVPLLEAMGAGLPVIALAGDSAVADTMGAAGVLVRQPDHPRIAEIVLALAQDPELTGRVRQGQEQRLAEYVPEEFVEQFLKRLYTLSN